MVILCMMPIQWTFAQNSECAEVKIVIEQKLSFERQAFDAKMLINNGLSNETLKNIRIELLFSDKENRTVKVTQSANENDNGSKFFYRVNSLTGINALDGNGQIAPKSKAEMHWLIIPAYGAAENEDTLYYIGAKVTYTLNGQETSIDVVPDYVVVKPQPLLSLDYFLPSDVYADDPFTSEVESAIPFTLGMRVKNEGKGISYKTVIDSAQPKIVENKQNLLIDFAILGGFVDNQSKGKSLLLDFGDIEANSSRMGRWQMMTSLSGKFIEFDANFTHADALGGSVTSLLKETRAHQLIHDVKVDLPDSDDVADFLAADGDIKRVYQSNGLDVDVSDQSDSATLETANNIYKLIFPATQGFVYTKIADPYQGKKALAIIKRSDGKTLLNDNVWLSKSQNEDLSWSHYINIFDSDSTGIYELTFNKNDIQDSQSSISGMVYHDLNVNGFFDNEPGIANVKVNLTGENKSGLPVKQTTYTDQAGTFVFNQLVGGRYHISISNTEGMNNGSAFPGKAGGEAGIGEIKNIVLTNNTVADNNLFAKYKADQIIAGNSDISLEVINESRSNRYHGQLQLIIKNNGSDTVRNISLEAFLPPGMEIIRKTILQGKYHKEQDRIDVLKKNRKTRVRFRIKPISGNGQGNFVARVSSQNSDSDLTNNFVSIPLSIPIKGLKSISD